MKLPKIIEAFEDPNGVLSFSRTSTAVVLAAWLTWVTIIVCNTKTLPSGMWEISTVVGVLYSLGKAAEVAAVIATASTTPTQATTTSSTVTTDTTKVS